MTIRRAEQNDAKTAAALAAKLWDTHTAEALEPELRALLSNEAAAVFLAYAEERAAGFAQCQLRYDYVEGTHTSPVGYLEGIYVEEALRGQGLAARLLQACETWARAKGCTEFASDCTLENHSSFQFHLHAGFQEANRIICFTKAL